MLLLPELSFWEGGAHGPKYNMLCNQVTCASKQVGNQTSTSSLQSAYGLLSKLHHTHFCVLSYQIFWRGCFATGRLLRPRATAPLCPPVSYATVLMTLRVTYC